LRQGSAFAAQDVRAGVESYSIKRLEPLCGYRRQVDLRDATAGLIAFEAALEDGTAAGDRGRQQVVAGYNEDDCRSTLALRDWLEDRRRELTERMGQELPRPRVAAAARAPEDPEVTRKGPRCWPAFPRKRPGRPEGSGPGRCWPTCSTGTGARPSRAGGGISTSAR
jgi:uncharacterized protein